MITRGVRDMARAVRFCEEGLGPPKIDSPPEVAFFNLNGTWFGPYGWDDLAEDASQPADGQEFRGATIVKPAQKATWGGYHGYFRDSDGHVWEIAQNPFMWVGPEDA